MSERTGTLNQKPQDSPSQVSSDQFSTHQLEILTAPLLKQIRDGQLAKYFLTARNWSNLNRHTKEQIEGVLENSPSLTLPNPHDLPEKIPQLRPDTAIAQIKVALAAQQQLLGLRQEHADANGSANRQSEPKAPKDIKPPDKKTVPRRWKRQPLSEADIAQLSTKTNDQLVTDVLNGRIARQTLAFFRQTKNAPIITASEQLRGYLSLPAKPKVISVEDATPAIDNALKAHYVLTQRLTEYAEEIIKAGYPDKLDDFSQVVEQAVIQTVTTFKPSLGTTLEAKLQEHLEALVVLADVKGNQDADVRPITMRQLLSDIGLSAAAFSRHQLGDGLNFETSGAIIIVSPENQTVIKDRWNTLKEEMASWEARTRNLTSPNIVTAKTPRRTGEGKSQKNTPPPEGSKTIEEVIDNLGISKGTYYARRLTRGISISRYNLKAYVTPEQQATIAERNAAYPDKRKTDGERMQKISIPDGYVKRNDLIRKLKTTSKTFKSVSMEADMETLTSGKSIYFSPEQVAFIEELYAESRKGSLKSSQPQTVPPPEGAITVKEFTKNLGISTATYYSRKLAEGLDIQRYGHAAYLTLAQQEAAESKYKQLRASKAERVQKAKVQIPEGHVRLSVFLKDKGISAYVFKQNKFGDGVVETTKGRSPYLSPGQQEQIETRFMQYLERRSAPRPAKEKTPPPEGAKTVDQFVQELGISKVSYYAKKLGSGLGLTRYNRLTYLTIEQQEIAKQRYEEQKTAPKLPKEKPSLPEGAMYVRDFIKSIKTSSPTFRLLAEGMEFSKIGKSRYLTAEQQELVLKKRQEKKAARSSKQPKEKPSAPEGAKTVDEFAKELGISKATYYGKKLGFGLNLSRYGGLTYLTLDQQEIAKQRYEDQKPAPKVPKEKPTPPDGHVRLSVFLKENGISANVYHSHKLGEGIVEIRKGISPFIGPEQQQAILANIDKYKEQKTHRKSGQNLREGYQKVKAFLKSIGISTAFFNKHNLGEELAQMQNMQKLVSLSPQSQEIVMQRYAKALEEEQAKQEAKSEESKKKENEKKSKGRSYRYIRELISLIPQAKDMDAVTFQNQYLDTNGDFHQSITTHLNTLTVLERDVVDLLLEGLTPSAVGQKLKMNQGKVHTIREIATQRLGMTQEHTGRQSLFFSTDFIYGEYGELATITPNQMKETYALSRDLANRHGKITWQKLSEELAIDPQTLKCLIYLGTFFGKGLPYESFDREMEKIPLQSNQLPGVVKNAFDLMMEHGSLLNIMLKAHRKNGDYLQQQVNQKTPSAAG